MLMVRRCHVLQIIDMERYAFSIDDWPTAIRPWIFRLLLMMLRLLVVVLRIRDGSKVTRTFRAVIAATIRPAGKAPPPRRCGCCCYHTDMARDERTLLLLDHQVKRPDKCLDIDASVGHCFPVLIRLKLPLSFGCCCGGVVVVLWPGTACLWLFWKFVGFLVFLCFTTTA